eukprot:TRINITY_DN12488_c0_g1_i1.p1 TRINITY_DN12488_c0_g1~~TRINITY_DN12488_c0_g1_i1.p1  ORF type:complete len:727 (-),score=207.53 TRINITY_DN12488_c0_g1_i1:687-2846(-)
MEEIGDLINKKKRESEQIFRIVQIQSSLEGQTMNIVEPSRRFVSEGDCIYDNQKMKYFLFNNLLLFSIPLVKSVTETKYKYYKHFFLTKDTLLEDEEKPPFVKIISAREKLIFKFENESDCISFKKTVMELAGNLVFNEDNVTMEEIGDLINKKKRESEQIFRIVQIQSSLEGQTMNIVEPSRRFVSEGDCIYDNQKMKYFLFNNLLLFSIPLVKSVTETKYKYYKHFFLTKDTLLEDEEKPPFVKIISAREKLIFKFENESDCISFKKTVMELAGNLVFNEDNVTTEDALKGSTQQGILSYKKTLESNFIDVFLKLKGNTLFFYPNETYAIPNYFVNMSDIFIGWAEDRANVENVVEFSKNSDQKFKPFYLHYPKQKVFKQWLKNFSLTSAKIEAKVQETYMQDIPNTIYFKISCEDLDVKENFEERLFFCALTIRKRSGGSSIKKWSMLSATEFFPTNKKSFVFNKFVKMEYNFSEVQRLRFVLFEVDQNNKLKYLRKDWKNKPKFGKVIASVSEIVSQNGRIEKNLAKKNTTKNIGKMKIELVNQLFTHSKLCTKINGEKLDAKDFLGKSDPFLVFLSEHGNAWEPVYKTDYIYQDLNPQFEGVELSVHQLVHGDMQKPFKIQCFDWNVNRRYELIGEIKMSVEDALNKPFFKLINPEKISQNSYNDSGILKLNETHITNKFSTISYLKGGLKLNLILGIDFSNFNGTFTSKYSLH